MDALIDQISALRAAGKPFALATVVRCERPTSARPGDRALVYADGRLEGWVGGACAQPLVAREALKALADGQSRLIGLSGEGAQRAREGLIAYPMSCHSGGTLEIFIEPFLPQVQLAVVGLTPIARALARIGAATELRVQLHERSELDAADFDAATYVVVASQGDDEPALLAALRSPAPYVGLIASARRAAALRAYLRDAGLDDDALRRLKAPAGLDIGAHSPDEIALSVLAEVVQLRRRGMLSQTPFAAGAPAQPPPQPETAIDPVCGMEVAVSAAQHSAEHNGVTYYFCCPGCRGRFVKHPERFLSQPPA
jgi:xanthine dehydrogenase accessory factor